MSNLGRAPPIGRPPSSISNQLRVRLIPLAPAALQPPSAIVMMHRAPTVQFRTPFFSLQLYPLHSRIEQSRGGRMPPILGPPWLPFPPSPETHQGRHIRRYLELLEDRENGRPRLHAGILIGRKRVHKRAVVRNRCKTRLMAALRNTVQQDPTLHVHSSTLPTRLLTLLSTCLHILWYSGLVQRQAGRD